MILGGEMLKIFLLVMGLIFNCMASQQKVIRFPALAGQF